MAPTMPVSAPSAGGSKSAIAPCGATRFPRMRCASVACLPGVATSLTRRTEPSWRGSCSKQELPSILMACSFLTSWVPSIERSLLAPPHLSKQGTALHPPDESQGLSRSDFCNKPFQVQRHLHHPVGMLVSG